ncbi:MAG TPA: DUF1398 family protein [Pirellulales bacterium]|jgi:uncharacterized protein YbcV (DUF1398 family)|nr:DUF1398 family protein [Pirellulales bacterium]
MNTQQSRIMEECARGAITAEISFPEIIGKLADLGVERYHADYSRQEITYYLADGDSLAISTPHPDHVTAVQFSPSAVAAAVGQSQRNEHTYLDFVRKTMAAGCIGYFVHITGHRVFYLGRDGEFHLELFPSAPVSTPTT